MEAYNDLPVLKQNDKFVYANYINNLFNSAYVLINHNLNHPAIPDYSPAEIMCPGNLVENRGNPVQTGVFDFIPFGMQMPDRSYVATGTGYRFGFNNMEKDDELKGPGNSYDFGARIYDPRVGRWLAVDPLASKYPGLSPYAFVANMPLTAIDPDGKDIILIIYTVKDGDVGHAAIAVENYKAVKLKVMENGKEVTKTVYEGTGTYTFYELGPQEGIGGPVKALFDQEAYYGKSGPYTESDLINKPISVYEDHAPDGIIKFDTNFETDQRVLNALNQFKTDNPNYNATSANCCDFASCGVGAKENLAPFVNTSTPNKLFQKASNFPGAQVLKDPDEPANKPFKEAYNGSNSDNSKKK